MTAVSERHIGDSPADGVQASVALLRIANTVRARCEVSLAGIDLSWARYEILSCLTRVGAMTYSQLGHSLVRHRTSIATTVSALERAGLVVRESNPERSQQHLVRVTERGESLRIRADRMLARRYTPDVADDSVFEALSVLERRLLTPADAVDKALPSTTFEGFRA